MKKVFEGMTPPQIWEYIKNLPIEEREKLLFENDIKENDMKPQKGAWILVDKKFNIPLFAAEKQMYLCTNVEETISAPAGKTYTISFSEIKTLNYNVPERVDMALFVPEDGNGGMVNIHMVEVHPEHGNLPLSHMITLKENISSLGKLKQIFYNLGKKI